MLANSTHTHADAVTEADLGMFSMFGRSEGPTQKAGTQRPENVGVQRDIFWLLRASLWVLRHFAFTCAAQHSLAWGRGSVRRVAKPDVTRSLTEHKIYVRVRTFYRNGPNFV